MHLFTNKILLLIPGDAQDDEVMADLQDEEEGATASGSDQQRRRPSREWTYSITLVFC